jgi:predicted metalloprotease
MSYLNNGTAAAAKEQEEDFPLICEDEEECDNNNKNSINTSTTTSSSSLRTGGSTNRHQKCNKCMMLFLLITIIALSAALVSVSQLRISISIAKANDGATTAAADDTKNDGKDFQKTDSVIDDVVAHDDDPYRASATSISSNSRFDVDFHTNRFD